jgi:hypothetical protein
MAAVTNTGIGTEDASAQNNLLRDGPDPRLSASTSAVNNTTQHENPVEVDSREDVDDIKRWLEARLVNDLERSAVELDQGQVNQAERILGEEFADQFDQYAYIVERTGTNDDDRVIERLRETKETQEKFTSSVQEYHETLEEYEQARQNGNEDRARRLARELQRLSGTADRTGSTVQREYKSISNETSRDLSEASTVTQNITRNISQQQAEVVQETFVRTTLTLRPTSRRISFLDPLRLTGRLVDKNGSALAEQAVRLQIGEQIFRTRTDANGTFTVTYRPTLLRSGDQSLPVRFVPENESVYLGTNESIPVSISQVTPELSIELASVSVAFNDTLEVTGRLSVDNIGAEAVPVAVRLGGVTLGTTRTNPDGTYSFTTRVPAQIDDGEQTLTTAVPLDRQALAGVNRSRSVTVDPTETALNVSGERDGEGTILVSGTLKTAGSSGIPNQQVDLLVDGRSVTTARTGPNGSFSERVSVPDAIVSEDRNASVTLVARYERPNSNLLSSRSRTTVRLQSVTRGPDIIPVPLAVAVAFGSLIVFVGAAIYVRRGRSPDVAESNDVESANSAGASTSAESSDLSAGETSLLLAGANTALENNRRDTAVKLAYTAVKRATTERLDLRDGTHWEFFVACREAGLDDDRIDTLRRLTETYEQAAFAPQTVSAADANWVVDAAATFD